MYECIHCYIHPKLPLKVLISLGVCECMDKNIQNVWMYQKKHSECMNVYIGTFTPKSTPKIDEKLT